MFGRNIDKNQVKVKARMKHFLAHTFEKFYIAIWSCMKLEDVLEVLLMLILDKFMEYFVFIWGREQCLRTFAQISFGSYYYLKDLKRVYYGCHGLPYGKEDRTLLIDYESSKTLRNPK